MAVVRHEGGKGLTLEQQRAMKAEIEEAARHPYAYDEDSPLLTKEQLAQFQPVNFTSMQERIRAMQKAGIIDPEQETQGAVLTEVRYGAPV